MNRILVYGMTNNKGGIETYIMNVYRRLNRYGIAFDFVTDFPSIVYEDEIKAGGSKIYLIPAKGTHYKEHIKAFRELLQKHPEYTIVYFNILNAGAAVTIRIAKQEKRKTIVHSHNAADDHMLKHRLFMPLLKRVADVRLACSRLAGKYMFGKREMKKEHVTVINNAIPVDQFVYDPKVRDEKRAELPRVPEDMYCMLHVGRMDRQKNPFFLLDCMKALHELDNRYILVYIGIGPWEKQVREYVAKNAMEPYVFFMGLRNDVVEWMQAADALLLPSLYEGLSIVLIEAQASGLPCYVSSNVSKEAKIIPEYCSISLKHDASQWAKEIHNGLHALSGIDRKRSAQLVRDAGYDIDTMIDKLMTALDKDNEVNCIE